MESRNVDDIAGDIGTILGDQKELQSVSECGRDLIEEIYSFQAAIERYSTLLSEVET